MCIIMLNRSCRMKMCNMHFTIQRILPSRYILASYYLITLGTVQYSTVLRHNSERKIKENKFPDLFGINNCILCSID